MHALHLDATAGHAVKAFTALILLFGLACAGSASMGAAAVGEPRNAAWTGDTAPAGSPGIADVDRLLPDGYRNPRPAEEAVQWALGQVGVVRDSGYCLRFVDLAFGRGSGPPSAYLVWTRSHPGLHHFDVNPPRGAVVVWSNSIGRGHGHIAISVGDGRMVSTTGSAVSVLPIRGFADSAYFGWMPPYFYM